jgi:hypothetical protein
VIFCGGLVEMVLMIMTKIKEAILLPHTGIQLVLVIMAI